MLRGGAYKPRTSPHDFQGTGVEGLCILRIAREETGLPIVTEVMDTRLVEQVAEYADMLQIGSRNMQNYPLLAEVGRTGKPVLLKRGMAASLGEWLGAAEYIAKQGNLNIVLCERGIKAFAGRRILALRAGLECHSRRAGEHVLARDRRSQPRHRGRLHGGARQPRGAGVWQPRPDD